MDFKDEPIDINDLVEAQRDVVATALLRIVPELEEYLHLKIGAEGLNLIMAASHAEGLLRSHSHIQAADALDCALQPFCLWAPERTEQP